MALLLTPRHFVTEMEENVKSIDNRVNDYIQDSVYLILDIISLTRSRF